MKIICRLLLGVCLAGSVTFAQTSTNETSVKLLGVDSVGGVRQAVMEIRPAGRKSQADRLILAEGQRLGTTELLKVDVEKRTVEVMVDGRKHSLELGPQVPPSGAPPENSVGRANLENVPLRETVKLYAELKGRTILWHPQLKDKRLSVSSDGSKEKMISAFEKAFHNEGIEALPDGDNLVLLVPTALMKTVAIRSREVVANLSKDRALHPDEPAPAGAFDFQGAPMTSVLQVYAQLIDCKLTITGPLPDVGIDFRNETTLTKAEVIYAFDTLFTWSGVALVLGEDKTLIAEPASR
jgi:hypothetical protein